MSAKYRPIRKDLTEGTVICQFCPNPLRSLKAYILEEIETGKIVFSGPKCAEKNVLSKSELNAIPDFTKFTLALTERDSKSTLIHKKGSREVQTPDKIKSAIEYLELREVKLVKECNTSYVDLKKYYSEYKETGELRASAIQHILNLEKRVPKKYKLSNLQRCYNYLFWIDVAIARLDPEVTGFMSSVRKQLVSTLTISEAQKNGVNKWIANLNGVPKLK